MNDQHIDTDRNPITYNEFLSVVIKLLRKGVNPTYEAIIEGLGGRGSKTTIKKFKTMWQQSLKETDCDILPPHIPKSLAEPLEMFFNEAVKIAESSYIQHKNKCTERVDLAYLELKEARAELNSLESHLRELENSEIVSSSVIERLESEIKSNELHSKELITQQEKSIDRLERALKQERMDSKAALQDALSTYEREKNALKSIYRRDTQELRGEVKERDTQISLLTKAIEDERARSVKENDYWIIEIDKERAKTAEMEAKREREVKRTKAELDVIAAREDRSNQRNGVLEKRMDDMINTINNLQAKVSELQLENQNLKSS